MAFIKTPIGEIPSGPILPPGTARRRALLEAVEGELGTRVRVRGAEAGLHVVLELAGARPARAAEVAARARAREVGVYTTAPFHLQPPTRAELLLGHGSLDPDEIRTGIARLAEALDAAT